jgi:hypothetical protein
MGKRNYGCGGRATNTSSDEELREVDSVVGRLREFLRLNYMTGGIPVRYEDENERVQSTTPFKNAMAFALEGKSKTLVISCEQCTYTPAYMLRFDGTKAESLNVMTYWTFTMQLRRWPIVTLFSPSDH